MNVQLKRLSRKQGQGLTSVSYRFRVQTDLPLTVISGILLLAPAAQNDISSTMAPVEKPHASLPSGALVNLAPAGLFLLPFTRSIYSSESVPLTLAFLSSPLISKSWSLRVLI